MTGDPEFRAVEPEASVDWFPATDGKSQMAPGRRRGYFPPPAASRRRTSSKKLTTMV